MAAKLNGTSIEDPGERRHLADANQTMHDTRLVLRHGRGNVEADHRLSGGHGTIAAAVSEQLAGPNDNMLAGTALALLAGKCDARGHQQPGSQPEAEAARDRAWHGEQRVLGMVSSDLGLETAHTGSEIHKNPEPGTKKPSPIVMDSWDTGPAARPEDTVCTVHSQTTRRVSRFGKTSGKPDFDKMHQIRGLHEPGGERHAAAMQRVSERRPATGRMLQDVQLIEPAFAANAEEKHPAMSAFRRQSFQGLFSRACLSTLAVET